MSTERESDVPTGYAVHCSGLMEGYACGIVYLMDEEYSRQMDAPDLGWRCPRCGAEAEWISGDERRDIRAAAAALREVEAREKLADDLANVIAHIEHRHSEGARLVDIDSDDLETLRAAAAALREPEGERIEGWTYERIAGRLWGFTADDFEGVNESRPAVLVILEETDVEE